MIISDDRKGLDEALGDEATILMLIFGEDDLSRQVHDLALKAAPEAWRKTFLITNSGILSGQEKEKWFKGNGKYVTLSKPKVVVEIEVLEKFCKAGKPLARLIQVAFGKADQ